MPTTKTKGHWPAGKRQRGVVSRRVLAGEIGIDDRTLRRWLAGEDTPPADMLRRLKRWAEKHT